MSRIAVLALLAGIVVGTAYGQAEPYGGPPGARDPNDVYWPQGDASYDRCPDEPFGWATCHYGRWAWDSQVGWLWGPGTGLLLAAPLPYRFETQSTAVRPPMVAPLRRMNDPGPMSVAPRTKPAPRDNNEAAKPKKDTKGDDQQRPRPF